MSWIFTTAIVIILLIAGFMLFFFMPKPIVFFDPHKSITDILNENYDNIKKEIVDNQVEEVKDPVIPIYGFNEIKSYDYPVIYNLLQDIREIQTIGIINIKPKFQQIKEYGMASIVNDTIRYFYTIQESAGHKSGIWIDGERRFFSNKECIVGDMSREHSLFNKDKELWATVLFIDVARQYYDQNIPTGNSPNQDIDKDEILKMF